MKLISIVAVWVAASYALAQSTARALSGDSFQSVKTGPISLAVVRSWGDLIKQPALDADKGVTGRLGVSATHAPLHSGVLLYCFTERYDFIQDPNLKNDCLGPLSVSLHRAGKPLIPPDIVPILLSYKGWNTTRDGKLLFARGVVIDAPGTYEVAISTTAGRELATTTISTDDSFYHPWTPFHLEKQSEWEWLPPRLVYTFRQTRPAELSLPGMGIGMNNWCGSDFDVFSGYVNRGWDIKGENFKPRPLASPLPELVPEKPDPTLRLSIKKDLVTITSNVETEFGRPDQRLLARWWVNGKPFVPAPGRPDTSGEDVIHFTKIFRFKLDLDPAKIGAHPGDRIGLQILLCDSWRYVDDWEDEPQAARNGRARLSNRVEFTAQ